MAKPSERNLVPNPAVRTSPNSCADRIVAKEQCSEIDEAQGPTSDELSNTSPRDAQAIWLPSTTAPCNNHQPLLRFQEVFLRLVTDDMFLTEKIPEQYKTIYSADFAAAWAEYHVKSTLISHLQNSERSDALTECLESGGQSSFVLQEIQHLHGATRKLKQICHEQAESQSSLNGSDAVYSYLDYSGKLGVIGDLTRSVLVPQDFEPTVAGARALFHGSYSSWDRQDWYIDREYFGSLNDAQILDHILDYVRREFEHWGMQVLMVATGCEEPPFNTRDLTIEYLARAQEMQEDRGQEEMRIQFRPPSPRRGVYNYRLPDEFYAAPPSSSNTSEGAVFVMVLLCSVVMTSTTHAMRSMFVTLFMVWLFLQQAQKHFLVLNGTIQDCLGLICSRQQRSAMKVCEMILGHVLLI